MNLGPVAKALVGAAAAGVAPYTAAIKPWSQGGAHVTLGEWITVALAVLIASRLVWQADNVRWFKYAKATAAALVVFLGPLAVAFLANASPSVELILSALVQTAMSFGIVSQVPNAPVTEWNDPAGGDGELAPRAGRDVRMGDLQPGDIDELGATVPGPVDANDDGHDDRTGRFVRLAVPGGALALILGGGFNARA